MKSTTVTHLNNQLKGIIEASFELVCIHGEVSNLVHHGSGHSYFSLKDQYSTIRCVLFKGNKASIKVHLENGQKIVVKGGLSVYSPRGEYQVKCFGVELFGQGDLYVRFEALKNELRLKGYFDESRKKPIGKFLDKIALVTSKSGAVIQDMCNVANKRWPAIELCMIDVAVQGANAPMSIVEGIQRAISLKPDVIVVARGGGSLEDLWAFNERVVADAIFECPVPIVSAIGHETDYLISDFVADMRCPTPSAAMETLLPDKDEFTQYLDDMRERYKKALEQVLVYKQQRLHELKKNTKYFVLKGQFEGVQDQIQSLNQAFNNHLRHTLYSKSQSLPNLSKLYENLVNKRMSSYQELLDNYQKAFAQFDPKKSTPSGKAKIFRGKNPVGLKELKVNDTFFLEDVDCKLGAKAISKTTV